MCLIPLECDSTYIQLASSLYRIKMVKTAGMPPYFPIFRGGGGLAGNSLTPGGSIGPPPLHPPSPLYPLLATSAGFHLFEESRSLRLILKKSSDQKEFSWAQGSLFEARPPLSALRTR